jgi:hypothetical protein
MLTLDHIADNGGEERKQNGVKGGQAFYRYLLLKLKLPTGLQTLCRNHQWKKRIVNLREAAYSRVIELTEPEPSRCTGVATN